MDRKLVSLAFYHYEAYQHMRENSLNERVWDLDTFIKQVNDDRPYYEHGELSSTCKEKGKTINLTFRNETEIIKIMYIFCLNAFNRL